jgi:hypothetical protein
LGRISEVTLVIPAIGNDQPPWGRPVVLDRFVRSALEEVDKAASSFVGAV